MSPMGSSVSSGSSGCQERAGRGAGELSVSEVAWRWGFAHHGRFAAQYRTRFGETPSQTLRAGAGG